MISGVDLSNHNHALGPIDFVKLAASGVRFVVLKTSEGVGWKDPFFDDDRAAAHAAGLIVLAYHFARGGANTPAAEAAWFLQCVGPLAVGEGLVLDDEVAGIGPAWVQAWCGAVQKHTSVWPLVYMNQATRDSADWSGVGANDGLWLAKYDGSTAMPPGGSFGGVAMKQYSDAGQVAGIVGGVDLDVFYGSADQLLAYGLHSGATTTTTVREDDMRLIQNTDRGIALVGDGYVQLTPTDLGWAQQLYGSPTVFANAADYDACVSAHIRAITGPVWEDPTPTRSVVFPIDRLDGIDTKTGDLETKVDALASAVAAVQSALSAMPAAACQGNPKAVLSALGQAATTAATSAT